MVFQLFEAGAPLTTFNHPIGGNVPSKSSNNCANENSTQKRKIKSVINFFILLFNYFID
jgi:hypothetical protein